MSKAHTFLLTAVAFLAVSGITQHAEAKTSPYETMERLGNRLYGQQLTGLQQELRALRIELSRTPAGRAFDRISRKLARLNSQYVALHRSASRLRSSRIHFQGTHRQHSLTQVRAWFVFRPDASASDYYVYRNPTSGATVVATSPPVTSVPDRPVPQSTLVGSWDEGRGPWGTVTIQTAPAGGTMTGTWGDRAGQRLTGRVSADGRRITQVKYSNASGTWERRWTYEINLTDHGSEILLSALAPSQAPTRRMPRVR